MKLMIVDDHEKTRGLIREMVGHLAEDIIECASGVEAVRCARHFKPDWVTMDVHMSGLNGYQTAEVLQGEHPKVRIVMVTSDSEPAYRQLTRAIGAVGHVCKDNLIELRQLLEQSATA